MVQVKIFLIDHIQSWKSWVCPVINSLYTEKFWHARFKWTQEILIRTVIKNFSACSGKEVKVRLGSYLLNRAHSPLLFATILELSEF